MQVRVPMERGVMTTRAAVTLCALLVFVALATVLHTWQTIWSWLGDALSVWLTVILEGVG